MSEVLNLIPEFTHPFVNTINFILMSSIEHFNCDIKSNTKPLLQHYPQAKK